MKGRITARYTFGINFTHVVTFLSSSLKTAVAIPPLNLAVFGVSCFIMNRITVDPEQCGGRPCIRGMRIRVVDVLDLLANGLTAQQVVEDLPDLELADVKACLQYASRRLNHPILASA